MTADTDAVTGRPRVLCVGAYERDNFGDLLFQLITAEYLKDADVVFAAPFAADMTEWTGERIPAFGPLLASERFDAIWTVGGEVGGTSIDFAYKSALGAEAFDEYQRANDDERRRLLAEHMGPVPVESPYLPRASAYAKNVQAAVVVNSVGVAALPGLAPLRRAAVTGILREATRVSVRDRMASDVLTAAGIDHTLEPDLVHSIALTRPRAVPPGDHILLQISDAHLKKYTADAFIKAIVGSPLLAQHPVRMFLAGTAPGHDSLAAYERIVAAVREADPSRSIEISTSRRPWDRVDEIATARAWIGGSLHGRIVASAYGVPRVSLAKRKLDEYAQTWDPEMPWGVTPETLDSSLRTALEQADRGRGDVAERLGRRAHENALSAVEHVHDRFARPEGSARLERIIEVRNLQWQQLVQELPAVAAAPVQRSFVRKVRRRLGRIVRRVTRRG